MTNGVHRVGVYSGGQFSPLSPKVEEVNNY